MIIPSLKLKLGIQPLHVHSTGCIGLASRSGTISYELAALTTELGFGQSIVFGLGGDPFPGTRTWEALRLMLDDPKTERESMHQNSKKLYVLTYSDLPGWRDWRAK